jgi:hypothetical protein
VNRRPRRSQRRDGDLAGQINMPVPATHAARCRLAVPWERSPGTANSKVNISVLRAGQVEGQPPAGSAELKVALVGQHAFGVGQKADQGEQLALDDRRVPIGRLRPSSGRSVPRTRPDLGPPAPGSPARAN